MLWEAIDDDYILGKKLECLESDKFIPNLKFATPSEPPTERQMAGIRLIEEELGIKYKGLLYKHLVSNFLKEHLEDAKYFLSCLYSGDDYDSKWYS